MDQWVKAIFLGVRVAKAAKDDGKGLGEVVKEGLNIFGMLLLISVGSFYISLLGCRYLGYDGLITFLVSAAAALFVPIIGCFIWLVGLTVITIIVAAYERLFDK